MDMPLHRRFVLAFKTFFLDEAKLSFLFTNVQTQTQQSCPWVGLTHGWVGSGWVHYSNSKSTKNLKGLLTNFKSTVKYDLVAPSS